MYNPHKVLPVSDHFDGKKFFNPHTKEKFPYFRLLKWLIKRKEAKWPKWVKNSNAVKLPSSLKKSQIAVTFINHASFLIQTASLNIIIDPVYSKRVGPYSLIGPKRVRLPGIPFTQLPPINIVFISHNHYDHLDIKALKRIKEKHNPLFITGLGNKKLLNSHGIKNVIELDWWESYVYEDTEVVFTPAQHFSSRTPFDRNETLWGGIAINTRDKKIYYSGDTGYGPHFKEIYKKFGSFDLAFLPIGSYKPRWFMKMMHINPEEAVEAHLDLQSKLTIPVHYGTFPLSDEPFEQPLINLSAAMEKHNVSSFRVLDFGETLIIT